MEYLTVDKREYHALSDGLTFQRCGGMRIGANFRFDFMSITEGKKTDPATRNVLGSVHLRDLLPCDDVGDHLRLLRAECQELGDRHRGHGKKGFMRTGDRILATSSISHRRQILWHAPERREVYRVGPYSCGEDRTRAGALGMPSRWL